MRATLQALAEELRRQRANGVTSVTISEDALRGLREAVNARVKNAAPATDASAGPHLAKAEAMPAASKVAESRSDFVSATPNRLDQGRALQKPPTPTAPKSAPAQPTLPPPPVVKLPEGDKATRWQALCEIVNSDPVCQKNLRPGKRLVVGAGSLDAKLFFCNDAPGPEEELSADPFIGPAGQLLTKMIQAMGLRREDVYIGNIMSWRPLAPATEGIEQTESRTPTAEELAYGLPYLRAQIEIVQPDLIVALGATATKGLLGPSSFKTLNEVRCRWHDFQGKPLMVTYNPSYILNNPSNRSKRAVWEAFLLVMERAQLPISDKQRKFFLDK